MGSVTFGDIFFIALVGGGIYLLLGMVNRSRNKAASDGEKTQEGPSAQGEGGPPGRSDNHS